ncbi:Ldh family oxidoreductase [bacterium]|nr:Ldh family oxidoreductase [bacterium]
MSEFHVVPADKHDVLVKAAYEARGYTADEAAVAAEVCADATRHGIRTHNALKALHLDHLFGSVTGGCKPGAEIEIVNSRFKASEVWNANKKLGQAVAVAAMDRCMELADEYGIGQVAVDDAFHYLWGGGYVMKAAEKGYIAYTNCTSTLAEVVPFFGKHPTMGTNPHSWGFPTQKANGFPIVIDWATSTVAMGRVQQLKREGKELPPGAAVDKDGKETRDPNEVAALLPFGAHKGYAMCLINELVGGYIGGSLPTQRGREGEKTTTCFYFQCIHPDAWNSGQFAGGASQSANVTSVIDDVLGHGNEKCLLPGQMEAQFRKRTDASGGLLFSPAEIAEFKGLGDELGISGWELANFPEEA